MNEYECTIIFATDGEGEGFILNAPKEAFENGCLDSPILSDNIDDYDEIPKKVAMFEAVLHVSISEYGGYREPPQVDFSGSLHHIRPLYTYADLT